MTDELRPDLPEMPHRIKGLPRDHRGFPIPWFVANLPDGTRDFRIADPRKRTLAVKHSICWVCGGTLGMYKAFVIGPMCAVTRTTSEPPCHLECAQFSAKGCPFLARPRMKRNEKGLDEMKDPPGVFLTRNPGCACVWVTKSFKTFRVENDWLIQVGEPTDVYWYALGKDATRAQVMESISSGYPVLEKEARKDGNDGMKELAAYLERVYQYLPAA